jgi:hypothetical protein
LEYCASPTANAHLPWTAFEYGAEANFRALALGAGRDRSTGQCTTPRSARREKHGKMRNGFARRRHGIG